MGNSHTSKECKARLDVGLSFLCISTALALINIIALRSTSMVLFVASMLLMVLGILFFALSQTMEHYLNMTQANTICHVSGKNQFYVNNGTNSIENTREAIAAIVLVPIAILLEVLVFNLYKPNPSKIRQGLPAHIS